MAGCRALRAGRFADADDRVGRERIGDDQLFLAALDRVAVGEVPRRRCRVRARRDRAAGSAVGALLDEPTAAVDLHHRRHERALRLHLGEVEDGRAASWDLEWSGHRCDAGSIGERRDLAGRARLRGGWQRPRHRPAAAHRRARRHRTTPTSRSRRSARMASLRCRVGRTRRAHSPRAATVAGTPHRRSWRAPSTRRRTGVRTSFDTGLMGFCLMRFARRVCRSLGSRRLQADRRRRPST